MRNFKRLLTAVSAMIIGATCLTAGVGEITLQVNAESTAQSDSTSMTYGALTYEEKTDGTLVITGCDDSVVTVDIPAEIDGKAVVAISNNAFYNKNALTSVRIPEGVTHVYSYAFASCESLVNIEIPSTLNYVYNGVFSGTQWLKDRQAEDPLVIINGILIDGTTASGDVVIPDNVKCISWYAFVLPGNMPGIAGASSQITSVTIPGSVENIYAYAFEYCPKLETVTMAEGVKNIGLHAFYDCKSLNTVEIPSSVTDIMGSAFGGTPWLAAKQAENQFVVVNNLLIDGTTVSGDATVPEDVRVIMPYAFGYMGKGDYNTEMTSLTVPKTVEMLDGAALSYCDALEKVIIKNPDCIIYEPQPDDCITIPANITIYGYLNSTACDYAIHYGNAFETLTDENQTVKGDLNNDGELTLSDLVMMRKFMLGQDVTIDNFNSMDINGDGHINVFDFILMKRMYIAD